MSRKVLVVDDSLLIRTQVSKTLRGNGYEAVDAKDGVDALAKLEANPDVALIVCDVNMPQMGGIELLEELKSRPEHEGKAFVMLTTEDQASLVERAKSLGANGWITKPFKADTLVTVAQELLGA